MIGDLIEKTAAEILERDIDFTDWLVGGDTIASAAATVADSTATVTTGNTSAIVKLRVAGGADGDSGVITVLATTANGLVKETDIRLRVRDN